MKLTILGEPISLQRPRFSRRGGVYNPQAAFVKSLQSDFQQHRHNLISPEELTELAQAEFYCIDLVFYHQPPKTAKEAKIMAWGFNHYPQKTDIDNCIKFYLDLLNNLLYKDDRAIVEVTAKKLYSDTPRTEITLMPKKTTEVPLDSQDFFSIFSPLETKQFLLDIQLLSHQHDENEILSLSEDQKLIWLVDLSRDVIKFAEKYSDQLKKLKKCSKVAGEGKALY